MASHVHIQECDLSDSSDQFFTLSSELMSVEPGRLGSCLLVLPAVQVGAGRLG